VSEREGTRVTAEDIVTGEREERIILNDYVLIVDGDAAFRRELRTNCEQYGYQVSEWRVTAHGHMIVDANGGLVAAVHDPAVASYIVRCVNAAMEYPSIWTCKGCGADVPFGYGPSHDCGPHLHAGGPCWVGDCPLERVAALPDSLSEPRGEKQ